MVIAQRFGPDMAVIAAGCVVVGHVAPIWLLFKGGKGVATTLGVLLAIAWPVGLVALRPLARGRRPLPLFLPRRPGRDLRLARVRDPLRHAADLVAGRLPRGDRDSASRREHRAPRARARAPHRPKRNCRPRGRTAGEPMNVSHSSEPRTLNDAERLDWLRLARSENVGPITFFALLARFGTPAAVLDALPALARRGGRRRPIKVCSRAGSRARIRGTQTDRRVPDRAGRACLSASARRHRRPAAGHRPARACGPARG